VLFRSLLIAANHGIYGPKITEKFFEEEPKESWLQKTKKLIKKQKDGILEINKDSIASMK
jgi:hypothetical protein